MTEDDLQGKSLVELLDLLVDVPVPPPVSMMPQTSAWIVLAIILVTGSVLIFRRIRAHQIAESYRKIALSELQKTSDDPAKIAAVLRRTALAAYPRSQVAGLYGDAWLLFLDSSFPGSGFASGPGQILTSAAYQNTAPSPDLTQLVHNWIKTHKRGQVS